MNMDDIVAYAGEEQIPIRAGSYLGQQFAGNLQQCLQPYLNTGNYPYQTFQPGCSDLGSYEIRVEKYGTGIRMNYGSGLRILIADPIKGIDLREAIQKLKEALLEIKE